MRTRLAVLSLFLGLLPAQGPTFSVFSRPVARFGIYRVQQLLADWPNTRLAQLCRDPDVAPAIRRLLDFERRRLRRRREVELAAQQVELDLDPWQAARMCTYDPDPFELLRFPITQVQQAELLLAPANPPGRGQRTAAVISCMPRYEGQWTREFEAELAQLRKSRYLRRDASAKVFGLPADVFLPPDDEQLQQFLGSDYGRWLLHLPGTFVYGAGTPEPLEQIPTAARAAAAEAALSVDLAAFTATLGNSGMVSWEYRLLGLDKLRSLRWSLQFADELLLDQLTVELDEEPGGLIGALLTGTHAPPPQPLPTAALAQIRCSLNLAMLRDAFAGLANDLAPPPGLLDDVHKAFDGGIAIGCTAPPPGSVIPRVFLTAGVADPEAFDALLAKWCTDVVPTKQVRLDGVECTILKLPDMPPAFRPAFCRIDKTAYLAESSRSLRTLLKLRDNDAPAMDVGDAPLPPGEGELVPGFELRLDEARLYETFYKLWLPLFELTERNRLPGAVTRRQMPEPEVIAEYCRPSRGVLRRNGKRYTLAHLGTFGGPELAALAMTWAPMLSSANVDWGTEAVALHYARHRLQPVWKALAAFRQREQRWPKDLAELFAASKLPDDALLLPGDDATEQVRLADGRTIRSSFRYFPEPVKFGQSDDPVLLIEIEPRYYNRAVLDVYGLTPETYDAANRRPIDQFGPRKSPSSRSPAGGHDHR